MSLHINTGSDLTPEQVAKHEADERNDALIQDAVNQASTSNPAPKLLADGQQLMTTYERLAEKEAYAAGDKPSIIPLSVRVGPHYPGGFHYILSDADLAAVEAGFFCDKCLCRLPAAWTPACPTCWHER